MPDTRAPRTRRLDLAGVGLLTLGLLGIFVPLVEGRALGWPVWLAAPVVAAVVVLLLFVRHERAREREDDSALLPIRLFHDRGFVAGIVTQASFQGAMNAFSVVFLIYVQALLGFSALVAGLTLLPFSLGAFVGTAVAVPAGARFGKPVVTAGALLQAVAIAWTLALVLGRSQALTGWDVVAPLVLAGVGLGLLVVPLTDIALAAVEVRDAGSASGALSTFQQLGAATGVAVTATVFFGAVGTDWSLTTAQSGLTGSMAVAIGGYLVAAVASVFLPGLAAVRAHGEAEQAAAE